LLAGATLLAAASTSSVARANGRFPESNHLFFSPKDPDLVLLRTTFGLLVSHDHGKNFDWVCEQSIGSSGVEDPMYAITPSNNFVVTTFEGLTVSKDQACTWSMVGGELQGQVFIDLSANPSDLKDVVVFASSYAKQDDAGNILFTSKMWETKDEGATFTPLGTALDPGLLGYTVDLAKSDANRIYASAVRNPGAAPVGALLTSKNHGTSWDETVVPLENSERSLFIAAVDPNNADRVYLRTANTSPDKPTRLLLREANPDGGPGTVRTIFTAKGALLGFALSDDGSKVYIGGPSDGLQVASTTDFQFQTRSDTKIGCLAINADGLWACSNEQVGFIAGLSKDDGKTFTPLLHFCDIRGALSCGASTTTGSKCTQLWPGQRALLGCAGVADDGGTGDTGDAGPTTPGTSGSGSKCDMAPPGLGGAGAALSVAGAAVALIRRRSRRRRR
jgi:hypothetical protein